MRLLYLDLSAGAAGDMLLGALVDAGADEAAVQRSLDALSLDGWDLHFERVRRAGTDASKAVVVTRESAEPRNLASITTALAMLDEPIRLGATATFRALAEAEAQVHGTTIEDVHFHEVGALDAIVDIVGTHAALQDLSVDRVMATPLPLGSGTIEAAHGTLPVPAPATVELFTKHRIPTAAGGEGEAVTPTGAALVATIVDGFEPLPPIHIESVGYGAGDRDTAQPNVVRAFVGDTVDVAADTTHRIIETNVDDMIPELIPYALEAFIRAGADDAWVTPIQMKKNRPAFLLSILTHSDRQAAVMDALFRETTTLGCRIVPVEKQELERSWIEVELGEHVVRVKIARRAGDIVTMAPEYEDAAKVARATGRALKDVYAEALGRARRSASL